MRLRRIRCGFWYESDVCYEIVEVMTQSYVTLHGICETILRCFVVGTHKKQNRKGSNSVFSSTAFVKNRVKFRTKTNRIKIAFNVNRLQNFLFEEAHFIILCNV